VVEIAVKTDDIQTVVGNVHHSVSRDEQRPDCFRELGRQCGQFILSDANISEGGIFRDRVERVFALGDVTHSEDADAVYFRWLEPAIAVSENTVEKDGTIHEKLIAGYPSQETLGRG
jgi:hypothetical protein